MKYKVIYQTGIRIRKESSAASDKLGALGFGVEFEVVSTADHLGGERWAKLADGAGFVCVKQGSAVYAELVDNRPVVAGDRYDEGFRQGLAAGRKAAFDEVMAFLIGRN
jgi:hypothetical protein